MKVRRVIRVMALTIGLSAYAHEGRAVRSRVGLRFDRTPAGCRRQLREHERSGTHLARRESTRAV